MAWVRPTYFHIVEVSNMSEEELKRPLQPYAEANVLSGLESWVVKARKERRPYYVAKYAAMVPNRSIPMRVFGIFLGTVPTVSNAKGELNDGNP